MMKTIAAHSPAHNPAKTKAKPSAAARSKLQESADKSPATERLAEFQDRADGGFVVPLQRARTGSGGPGILQLKSPAQRRVDQGQFGQTRARMFIGRLKRASQTRDAENRDGPLAPAGAFVLYRGDLRDNFEHTALLSRNVERDHVLATLVTNGAGAVRPVAQWGLAWFLYDDIATESARSDQLQRAAAHGNSLATAHHFLTGLAGGGNLAAAQTRADRAPAAIRAWAESAPAAGGAAPAAGDAQARLGGQMPRTLGGHNNIPTMAMGGAGATIDQNNDLALERVDTTPSGAGAPATFFEEMTRFLALNAAEMPGTMARDHELRNERIGGQRAQTGRAWLAAYNKNLNDAEFVAITGSDVTNIFINRNAPTWEAYEANYQAHAGTFAAVAADWAPSQNLRGVNAAQDALVTGMTQGRAGEMYLFHGTSRANVFNIASSGFDPEFVTYETIKGYGKTGYGTAFTDQYAKALAYAPPEAVQVGAATVYKHYVLVARVFVGHSHQVGDQARRTRGNLEMTQNNINYEVARGNKMKAQGKDSVKLGQSSDTVRRSYAAGNPLHSTLQDRNFNLDIPQEPGVGGAAALPAAQKQYRDTSVTVSDAIQMYPAFIIEATIPARHVRRARRG